MDSKEHYNQVIFLETIKTGKTPKRSGLGYRLYLLAGFTDPLYATVKKNVYVSKYTFEDYTKVSINGLANRMEYYKSFFNRHNTNNFNKNLHSNEMQQIFQKYIGDHIIVSDRTNYISVYYKPNVVINWGQLDEDLLKKYPNNCKINKLGFVYYKQPKKYFQN
jgi:hypothetical protein